MEATTQGIEVGDLVTQKGLVDAVTGEPATFRVVGEWRGDLRLESTRFGTQHCASRGELQLLQKQTADERAEAERLALDAERRSEQATTQDERDSWTRQAAYWWGLA